MNALQDVSSAAMKSQQSVAAITQAIEGNAIRHQERLWRFRSSHQLHTVSGVASLIWVWLSRSLEFLWWQTGLLVRCRVFLRHFFQSLETLDCLIDFPAMDGYFSRGFKSEPHRAIANVHHRHDDVLADNDLLILLSGSVQARFFFPASHDKRSTPCTSMEHA